MRIMPPDRGFDHTTPTLTITDSPGCTISSLQASSRLVICEQPENSPPLWLMNPPPTSTQTIFRIEESSQLPKV